jgi:hypothetical protein
VEYFESVAVSLGSPDDLAPPVGGGVTVLPPEGALPGMLNVGTVTTTAEVLSYDRRRMWRFSASPRAMRNSWRSPARCGPSRRRVQPGDRVVITYDVASAITVTIERGSI